jgi:hypothetical protein
VYVSDGFDPFLPVSDDTATPDFTTTYLKLWFDENDQICVGF